MFVDTSFIVELLREQNAKYEGPARKELAAVKHLKLQLPVFVLCELRAGGLLSRDPQAQNATAPRF